MDAEYLNLYVLQNSIGLVVCGLLGAGMTWATKKCIEWDSPIVAYPAVLALAFFGVSGTFGYHVAKAYVAPQTVLSERAAK